MQKKFVENEGSWSSPRFRRGELQLGKVQLAKKLKITPPTLAKIEAGNYDAPKRIYESVIEWLLEDY